MDSSEHVRKVHQWVAENVQKFSTPKTLIINQIEFDWKDFCGSFALTLDQTAIKERFSISLGIDGRYTFSGPLFVSPLGAPASFGAIELSDETEIAITKALNQFFPKMLAFGLHPDTQKSIDRSTPIQERVLDHQAIERCQKQITSGTAQITLAPL
jgi:hypothetical protein